MQVFSFILCDFVTEKTLFPLYTDAKQEEFSYDKKKSSRQYPGMRCLRMLHKSLPQTGDYCFKWYLCPD
jgi:hypothetical protein